MNVTLRLVTEENWQTVARLKVKESQNDYVSSNVYSLAEASYRTHCQPRAVYVEDEVVGFVMYAPIEPLDAPKEYEIFRFMIDDARQAIGIGRKALELTIAEIQKYPGVESILICYVPTNPVAKTFYASFGFEETGLDEHGEMMAVIHCKS